MVDVLSILLSEDSEMPSPLLGHLFHQRWQWQKGQVRQQETDSVVGGNPSQGSKIEHAGAGVPARM